MKIFRHGVLKNRGGSPPIVELGLALVQGMAGYLARVGCLLKDFGEHVQTKTKQLIEQSRLRAEQQNRPIEYIESPSLRKEEFARSIAEVDGITEGLVAVLTCVEPCRTYDIFRNKETKKLELVLRNRKCLHIYHYEIHEESLEGSESSNVPTAKKSTHPR